MNDNDKDNNLDFLKQNNNKDLFNEIDQEIKNKKNHDEETITNDAFIKNLPDWDLPPLYERVRRVNRQ